MLNERASRRRHLVSKTRSCGMQTAVRVEVVAKPTGPLNPL